jgi:hypothetical protein
MWVILTPTNPKPTLNQNCLWPALVFAPVQATGKETAVKLTNTEKASQLHNYMTFRAEREHQRHDLTPHFYRQHLDAGITTFFGVDVGPNGLERDAQQPLIFRRWRAQPGKRDAIP